jgi:hypothetical protein
MAINSSIIDEEAEQITYSSTYYSSRFNTGNVNIYSSQLISYES